MSHSKYHTLVELDIFRAQVSRLGISFKGLDEALHLVTWAVSKNPTAFDEVPGLVPELRDQDVEQPRVLRAGGGRQDDVLGLLVRRRRRGYQDRRARIFAGPRAPDRGREMADNILLSVKEMYEADAAAAAGGVARIDLWKLPARP